MKRMEERHGHMLKQPELKRAVSAAEQIRIQQAPFTQALQSLQDIMEPYHQLLEQNNSGITAATSALASAVQTIVPNDAVGAMTESLDALSAFMQPYEDMNLHVADVLTALETAAITPELQEFRTQYELSVQEMGDGAAAIADYVSELTSQWDSALGITDVLERSMAAQNLAMIRMLPGYDDFELPCGSRKVLRSLTKTTARKLVQSNDIQFDPKEKDFYHKDSPDNKLSADQITVVESSLELFAEFTLDELLSFESKLEQNFAFAARHPVGIRIYEIIQNWNHFVGFEDITYYHARTLGENQRPFHDSEMMKAPINVSAHGRYNEVGRSCYYIAENRDGALKEIYKHSGNTKPCVQVIGLKAIKPVRLLDLSGDVKGTNRFIEHLRFTVENDEGRTVQEYLLPNYVASCCKELGIDGIRYKSTGYNCCVLWKDDYFEYAEGSREVIS